jgi:hypothetical protein
MAEKFLLETIKADKEHADALAMLGTLYDKRGMGA